MNESDLFLVACAEKTGGTTAQKRLAARRQLPGWPQQAHDRADEYTCDCYRSDHDRCNKTFSGLVSLIHDESVQSAKEGSSYGTVHDVA